MNNKYFIYFIIILFSYFNLFSEELKIKSVHIDNSLNNIELRKDANNDLCAFVRLEIPIEGCKFEGMIVDSYFRDKGYDLFISPQIKRIIIKCPCYETTPVNFSSFPEIKYLASGIYYKVEFDSININSSANQGNFVVMNIFPGSIKNSVIKIDNQLREAKNGQLMDFLENGCHNYEVITEGYETVTGTFVISPKEITLIEINLISEKAILNINCQTPGANIFLNGIKKAKNKWEGELTEGNYLIEITKAGFTTYSKEIYLTKNEVKNIVVTLEN